MAIKYLGNFWVRSNRPIIDGIPLPQGKLYRGEFQSIKMTQVGTGIIKYAQFRTLGIHPDGSIRYLGIGTDVHQNTTETEWVVETSDVPLPGDSWATPTYWTAVYICRPEITGENDIVYKWEPSVIKPIWRGPYFYEWEAWGWFLNPANSLDRLVWGRMYVVQYSNPKGVGEVMFQISGMQPRSQYSDLSPIQPADFAANADKIKKGATFFKDMVLKPRMDIPGGVGTLYYADINQWFYGYDSWSFPDPNAFQDGLGQGQHYWNHPNWVGPLIRPMKEYIFQDPANPYLNWPQNVLWQPDFRNTPSTFTGPVGGWPSDAAVPNNDLGNAYIRDGAGNIIQHFRYQPPEYNKDTPCLMDAESIVVKFVVSTPNVQWDPLGSWNFWSSEWWRRTPLRPVNPEEQCKGYWEADEIAPVMENPGFRGTYHPTLGAGDDDRNYSVTRRYVNFTTIHPRTGNVEVRTEFTYPQRRSSCRYEEYLYTHQPGYGRMRSDFTMPDIDQLYNQGTTSQQDLAFDTMIMIGLTEVERPVQHAYVSPWNYTKLTFWKRRTEFGDSFGEGNLSSSGNGIDGQALNYHGFTLGKAGAHTIKEEWADGLGRSSKLYTGIDMEHITCPEIQTFIRTGIYWFAERTCHKMECLQDSETAFSGALPIWSQRTLAYGLWAAKNAYYAAWYYKYDIHAGAEFINSPYSYHKLACTLWNRVLGDAGYINLPTGSGGFFLNGAQVPIRPPLNPSEVPPQQNVHWLWGPTDARCIFGMHHGGDWSGIAPWMDSQALQAAVLVILNERAHQQAGGGTSFPSRPDWWDSTIEVLRHHCEYKERVCHVEPGVPALSYHDKVLREQQGFGVVQNRSGEPYTSFWYDPATTPFLSQGWGGFWYKLTPYIMWTGRYGTLTIETAWHDPWAWFFPPSDNGVNDDRVPSYGSSTSWSPLGLGTILYYPEIRAAVLEPGNLVTWATNVCVRTFPKKERNGALDFWYAAAKQWVINGGAPAECMDQGGTASVEDPGGDGWPEKEDWPVTPPAEKIGQYWPDLPTAYNIELPYSAEDQ